MGAPESQSPRRLRLAASLDLKAAAPLLLELIAARGADVAVEAGDVRRLGAQCLQALLSARAAWASDGRAFDIRDPSPAFIEAAALMGAVEPLGLQTLQELSS